MVRGGQRHQPRLRQAGRGAPAGLGSARIAAGRNKMWPDRTRLGDKRAPFAKCWAEITSVQGRLQLKQAERKQRQEKAELKAGQDDAHHW